MMEISVVDCVREVIASEAESLGKVAAGLDGTVAGFVYEIDRCFGNIYLVGVGKSGDVAHKIASTLDSIGVDKYWLNMKEPYCKHIVIYPVFTLSKQKAMYIYPV